MLASSQLTHEALPACYSSSDQVLRTSAGVDNFVFAGPEQDLLVMLSKTKVFKLRVCTSNDST